MKLTIKAQIDPFKIDANVSPTKFFFDLGNAVLKLLQQKDHEAVTDIKIIYDYDQKNDEDTRRLIKILQSFSAQQTDIQDDLKP